jgi:DNA-binding MarR family transcriptional regulator
MNRETNSTARRLLDITLLLMRSLAAEMRKGEPGLTPMHVGLLAKIEAGETNMSELAQHLSVRLPTISKSVKLLVERGWVERWVPEENRRVSMVRLTPEGRRVFAGTQRKAEDHVAGLLDTLTAAERKRVDSALAGLYKALSRQSGQQARGEATV